MGGSGSGLRYQSRSPRQAAGCVMGERHARVSLTRGIKRRQLALKARDPRALAGRDLPAIVREGLVGLRHAVDVVLALVGVALLLTGVQQLVSEPLGHRLLATGASELDQPANGQRPGPARGNLDRNLVGGATDTARGKLEPGREGLDPRLQLLDGVLARAFAKDGQRVVDDLLGHRLLAVQHHLVDDLLDEAVAVDGIGLARPDLCRGARGHYFALTPY